MPNYFTSVIGMLFVSALMLSLFEHSENVSAKGNVMVVGEVVQPGRVPWFEHLRLWDALRLAKGFSPSADRDSTTITHSDAGVQRSLRFQSNLELAPGDTITVGSLPRIPFRFPIGSIIPLRIFRTTPEEQAKYSGIYTIEADGNIYIPGLEYPINAAGLTVPDLRESFQHAFEKAGKDFVVQIQEGCSMVGGYVAVGGQVAIPQEIPWQPGMRLGEVLAKAGGATIYGTLKKIRLLRGKNERVLDVSDRSPANNIEIEPNDQIIVPGN